MYIKQLETDTIVHLINKHREERSNMTHGAVPLTSFKVAGNVEKKNVKVNSNEVHYRTMVRA